MLLKKNSGIIEPTPRTDGSGAVIVYSRARKPVNYVDSAAVRQASAVTQFFSEQCQLFARVGE